MSKPIRQAPNGAAAPATAPAINIEQLAARVYQIMLEDARLARARGNACRVRK